MTIEYVKNNPDAMTQLSPLTTAELIQIRDAREDVAQF